jgi:hypothetical protein
MLGCVVYVCATWVVVVHRFCLDFDATDLGVVLAVVHFAESLAICGLLALVFAENALCTLSVELELIIVVIVIGAGAHVLEVHLDDLLVDRVALLELDEVVDEAFDEVDVRGETLLVVGLGALQTNLLSLE